MKTIKKNPSVVMDERARELAFRMMNIMLISTNEAAETDSGEIIATWKWAMKLNRATNFPIEAIFYLLLTKRIKVAINGTGRTLEVDKQIITQAIFNRKRELDTNAKGDKVKEFVANLDFIREIKGVDTYEEALGIWRESEVGI